MSKVLELIAFAKEIDLALAGYIKPASTFNQGYTITGGCLRDMLFSREVKDIDVVVSDKRHWEADWPNVADYGPTGEFAAGNSKLEVRGKPVQFIYRDAGDISIKSMMDYHSMSISNVFWSEGVLSIDPQCLQDYADKQHTVNRKRWGGLGNEVNDERLEKYIKKIQAKYDWPLRS